MIPFAAAIALLIFCALVFYCWDFDVRRRERQFLTMIQGVEDNGIAIANQWVERYQKSVADLVQAQLQRDRYHLALEHIEISTTTHGGDIFPDAAREAANAIARLALAADGPNGRSFAVEVDVLVSQRRRQNQLTAQLQAFTEQREAEQARIRDNERRVQSCDDIARLAAMQGSAAAAAAAAAAALRTQEHG